MRGALRQAVLTRGYGGINFIILNRGSAVTQTVNFNWYYGNKSNGQQWVWQVQRAPSRCSAVAPGRHVPCRCVCCMHRAECMDCALRSALHAYLLRRRSRSDQWHLLCSQHQGRGAVFPLGPRILAYSGHACNF